MTTLLEARKPPEFLPLQTRSEPVETVDAQARKVTVVFTTGATVRRQRYLGWDTVVPFDEVLTVSRDAVNLDRLNGGAPALDSHSYWTTASQVGVVENARIDGKRGLADILFPRAGTDPAADRMFAMVDQRIIRNVSVGYSIDEVEIRAPQKQGEVEQHVIKRWTPYEVSWVTIPADAGSQSIRSEHARHFPFAVTRIAPVSALGNLAAARMRMRQRSLG